MTLLPGVRGGFGSPEYELDRRATALKRSGDWDGAIAALRERKAVFGVQWTDTKLAKYLQQAGRFDEAMAEIQWLIDHSQAWAAWGMSHQPASVMQCQRVSYIARLHGAAVLICKRAGRADLMARHQTQRDTYAALQAKLEPIANADAKRDRQELEEANASGHAAMREYHARRAERTRRNKIDPDGRAME